MRRLAIIALSVVVLLGQVPNESLKPTFRPDFSSFTPAQQKVLQQWVNIWLSQIATSQRQQDEAIRSLRDSLYNYTVTIPTDVDTVSHFRDSVMTGSRIVKNGETDDTVAIKDAQGNTFHYSSDTGYVAIVLGNSGELHSLFSGGTSNVRYLSDASFIVRRTTTTAVEKYVWITMPRGRWDYYDL